MLAVLNAPISLLLARQYLISAGARLIQRLEFPLAIAQLKGHCKVNGGSIKRDGMDEGSDAVMNSEDNGFEHISAPKDESSSTDQEEEALGGMDTPEPVEPQAGVVNIDVSDPYSDGYPLAAEPERDPVPTGVEDVPRERKEGSQR